MLRLVDFLLDFFAEALRLTVERELFRADFFAADFFADFLAATISPYCLPFFVLFDFCICLNLLLTLAISFYLVLGF